MTFLSKFRQMFSSSTLRLTKEMETNMARITTFNDKFAIILDGAIVATYARKRDAVRGAARRGIQVA